MASPLKATLRHRIGSARSRSSNHKAALAPPATSLVWRNTEQEFRLCGGVDSLVGEATAGDDHPLFDTDLRSLKATDQLRASRAAAHPQTQLFERRVSDLTDGG